MSGRTITPKAAAEQHGVCEEAIRLAQMERRLPRPLTPAAVDAFTPTERDRNILRSRGRYHLFRMRDYPPKFDQHDWFLLKLYALDELSIGQILPITSYTSERALYDRLRRVVDRLSRRKRPYA